MALGMSAWLAGAFDMAGSIGIGFRHIKTGRVNVTGRFSYEPQMTLVTTYNEAFRFQVDKILTMLDIPHNIHVSEQKGNINPESYLVIHGWRSCAKLVRELLPYAVVKKGHFIAYLGFFDKWILQADHLKILRRDVDEQTRMFRRVVDWQGVEELIHMVETMRSLSTKRGKYNLKWTPEKIREAFRKVDGEMFLNPFAVANPRKKA